MWGVAMANSYCNPARLAAAIPAEIRSKPLWLTWKAGPEKPDGRFDKIPFYASGVRRHGLQGSDKDRAELVPFEQALKAVEKSPIGADGIGLALLPGCGVVAGDFDSCISGERRIPDNLRPLIEGTYAEISVSGTGIRTLWSGDCKSWKSCANHVEVFGDSGFVTLTGDLLQAEGLAPVPDWARSKINGKGSESVAIPTICTTLLDAPTTKHLRPRPCSRPAW